MSDVISVTHEGPASIVTLYKPPMNLLDIEVMDALVEAHQQADADPDTRVIVTRSGIDGMFSNGLNPKTVLDADLNGRLDIFRAVGRMVHGLFSLGKPHIAELNGPAMAGGAVLAITADFRYMEKDTGRICFAESKVGVPVPPGIVEIIRQVCAPNMLRDVVLLGKNVDAETALQCGLVDGLAPGDKLHEAVEKQVSRLARLSPAVLKATKRSLRGPVYPHTQRMIDETDSDVECFVGPGFLEEGLTALLESRHPVFKK